MKKDRTEKLGVYSPNKGKVKYALKTKSDYGYRVYIEYVDCIMMFAHLAEFFVKEGQEIEAGEMIGLIGATGYGSSAHLHISAFNKRAPRLTAEFAIDPTFTLKLAPYYPTNSFVSNGFGSKFCNPKLEAHEGIDFSATKFIPNWEQKYIDPLYQDYRIERDYPEEYTT